jgi:5-dehydro-2-deoxygluconokinase
LLEVQPTLDDGLDLICAGRADADMYAEQIGARLEDVSSFRMYLGGSAANIAVGASRMGLRSGMLTGVGSDALGTFVCKTLEAERVDVSLVKRDNARLTALVTLAIREQDDFPRIFYYSDSADMALGPEDVDWTVVENARSVLLTGTYLARPRLRDMALQMARFAREHGIRVILDVDFRPVLWGLVPHSQGNAMAGRSDEVASQVQRLVPMCDLIVGTEEELKVAANADSIEQATTRLRSMSDAVFVVKRGHRGCTIYRVAEGGEREQIDVAGVPVEVVNSVGAGDGFMSGFLAGWLRDRPLAECAELGNACGAIVVSRHGCTPAMPTRAEVDYFIANAARLRQASKDPTLATLHRVGTRQVSRSQTLVLAFDHRWQLEEIAAEHDAGDRLDSLKSLIYQAFLRVARGRTDVGILVDDVYGKTILESASGSGIWIGRALDVPRSHPLVLMGGDGLWGYLRSWPADQVAKVMAYAHPSDPEVIWRAQVGELWKLQAVCASEGREYLLELQPSPGKRYADSEVAFLMERFYAEGVRPEWWKLPPSANAETWIRAGDVIRANDTACRGMLVLGLNSAPENLKQAFDACAAEPLCRGFAVGRSVFLGPSVGWLQRQTTDEQLVQSVAERFQWFINVWEASREQRGEIADGVG